MTELLEQAVEAVRRKPQEVQDEVARAMLSLIGDGGPEPIDPDHRQAVQTGLGQLRRGEYASEEEVAAAFRSFDT
jgi:hypothetical protein